MMTEQVPEIQEKPIQPEMVSEIPQNKNFFKIVLPVVLGLIVVAGAVYAGYQFGRKSVPLQIPIDNGPVEIEVSPTPEVLADWKTYKNEKYGFEFKYPYQWEMRDSSLQDGKISLSEKENDCVFVIDTRNGKKVTLPVKDWFEKQGERAKEPCETPGCTGVGPEQFREETKIDGHYAVKYEYGAGMSSIIGYFIPYNKTIYSLEYNLDFYYDVPENEQKTICESGSNQILSTFKFIQ